MSASIRKKDLILTICCITILSLTGCSSSNSKINNTPNKQENSSPTQITPLLEETEQYYILGGDILLDKRDPEQQPYIQALLNYDPSNPSLSQQGFVSTSSLFWPNGEVPFFIDESVTPETEQRVREVMWEITQFANVKFIEYSLQKPYTYSIVEESHAFYCGASTLGKSRYAGMDIVCNSKDTIRHEFGHGLGLHHEHQRYDRDQYITIEQNSYTSGNSSYAIIPKNLRNNPYSHTIGTYDYESVMSYTSFISSKEGNKKISGETFSKQDKEAIIAIYGPSIVPTSNPIGNRIPTQSETLHPYPKNTTITHTFHQPGAKGMKIHFQKLEIEDGDDRVLIKDNQGRIVHIYTGLHNQPFTTYPVIGDTITVELISDEDITGYGYIIEGYSWF